MKIVLIVAGIIVVLFIVFQVYTVMSTKKSETQPYTVIRVEQDFEIRFYPSATMAIISSSAQSYKELGSSGFSKLAGYIFGGNKDKKQIAMTTPVHMNIGDSSSTMAFVMPATYSKDNLPLPNNSAVTIHETADEYVAAITFGGFASNEEIKKQSLLLENALKEKHIVYYGPFRFLGYNPPFQLLNRRNEIIVRIDKGEISETN
jgi:hypothetical protein